MHKLKQRPPNHHDGDSAETRTLIDWLLANKIYFVRHSRYHLKVDSWNYYIGKGTIFRDDEEAAETERGVEAFKLHLSRLSCIKTGGPGDFDLSTGR